MALRYFTHGYNIYHPGICCVRRLYERAGVLKEHGLTYEWPDCFEGRALLKLWIEKKRIMKLYGMEDNDQNMSGFDLGDKRTLQEFEEYAGICFKTRFITNTGGKSMMSYVGIPGSFAPPIYGLIIVVIFIAHLC